MYNLCSDILYNNYIMLICFKNRTVPCELSKAIIGLIQKDKINLSTTLSIREVLVFFTLYSRYFAFIISNRIRNDCEVLDIIVGEQDENIDYV